MAEARRSLEWGQTCEIVAMIHNVNCKPNDRITAEKINPTTKRQRPVIDPEDYMPIEALARIWVEGGRNG